MWSILCTCSHVTLHFWEICHGDRYIWFCTSVVKGDNMLLYLFFLTFIMLYKLGM